MTDFPKNLPASNIESRLPGARVVDVDGRRAHIVSLDQGKPDPTVGVRLEDGPEIILPLSLLRADGTDQYQVPVSFSALHDQAAGSQQMVIPVVQEQLEIDKRVIDTGKGVRIRKTVSEQEQIVDEPLLQDELIVEHVSVGQIVMASELPNTRYEGDTLVVPVFEEVLVVEKQMRLKEEVHITRRKHEVHAPQAVFLKSEQVSVEHFNEEAESFHSGGIPPSSQQIKPEPGKSAD
jgi:uncharacterized protein (TIGR02271 family)